jgi:NADH-quinone oxidoreductase subunit L
MVTAGVYVIARSAPIFELAPAASGTVAAVGALTALWAATIAIGQSDIKRVLAYSTISQLGYMMAALGLGAFGPALFHLFTHAFFKALLFLGAGSVNHAAGTFNMRYMGGLRRHMPWTYALLLLGGLSLAGIVPLAGFWSKDEIITAAWLGGGTVEPWVAQAVFGLLVAAALLTAFYTFRMIFMTFHGEFRGGGAGEIEDAASMGTPAPTAVTDEVHLGESPLVMVGPMLVLGVAAVLAGYLANPQWVKSLLGIPGHWFSHYVESALLYGHVETAPFNWGAAGISTAVALVGIGLAYLVYTKRKPDRVQQTGDTDEERMAAGPAQAGEHDGSPTEPAHGPGPIVAAPLRPEPLARAGPVHALLYRKYFIDELYEGLLVRRVFYRYCAGLIDWLDRNLVDGVVDLSAWLTRQTGRLVTQVQTGQVQLYGAVIVLGVVLIMVGYLAFGTGIGE